MKGLNMYEDRKPREVGEDNRTRVFNWFSQNICGKQVDCARELGLTPMTIVRHVKSIRAGWKPTDVYRHFIPLDGAPDGDLLFAYSYLSKGDPDAELSDHYLREIKRRGLQVPQAGRSHE